MQIEGLKTTRNISEIKNNLDFLTVTIDTIINETRSVPFGLCLQILYDLGLRVAIKRLTGQMLTPHNITITIRYNGEILSVSFDILGLPLHAAYEVLVNAIKHANAKHVIF